MVEIDHKDGVWIEDCVDLSRFIESRLNRDAEDFELEVGSAGIGQPFKVLQQYINHIGEEVEVLTKDVITPVKANVGGLSEMLASYEEEMMESKIVPMLPEDMRDEFRFLVYEPFSEREDARFGSVRGPGIKVWDTMAAYMEARMSRYYGVTSRVLRAGEAALAEKLRAYRTSADTEALMADLERVCSL